jgi:hypothetical protein
MAEHDGVLSDHSGDAALTADTLGKCLIRTTLALGVAAALPALAADNPLARGATWGAAPSAPIDGSWAGTNLERRSNCTSAQNDGAHGTWAQFDVATNQAAGTLGISEFAITGLNCSYVGSYAGTASAWNGSYSCSDGKRGTFSSRSISVTPNGLAIHLDVKLDTTESCAIEAVIGAGRFYP